MTKENMMSAHDGGEQGAPSLDKQSEQTQAGDARSARKKSVISMMLRPATWTVGVIAKSASQIWSIAFGPVFILFDAAKRRMSSESKRLAREDEGRRPSPTSRVATDDVTLAARINMQRAWCIALWFATTSFMWCLGGLQIIGLIGSLAWGGYLYLVSARHAWVVAQICRLRDAPNAMPEPMWQWIRRNPFAAFEFAGHA